MVLIAVVVVLLLVLVPVEVPTVAFLPSYAVVPMNAYFLPAFFVVVSAPVTIAILVGHASTTLLSLEHYQEGMLVNDSC